MSDVTLAVALDNLATHLKDNTSARLASRMTISQVRAEVSAPYIGVISNTERVNVKDPYTERTLVTVILHVVTKEQETGLEELKQEIKTALRTASLGDNIFGIEYDGSGITAIEDFRQADADKYSGVEMELTLQYADNFDNVPLLESGSAPSGVALYKTYSLMVSGSIADNVYSYHEVGNLQLPAITIGIDTGVDSEDDRSITAFQNQVINHQMDITIRYHQAYDPGAVNYVTVREKLDAIVSKCKKNFKMGDPGNDGQGYHILAFSVTGYNLSFVESATKGGQVNIRVDKLIQYPQET